MRFSPFIVVYDANVLYPNALRDLLIRLAQADIFQAKWSDGILDEMFNALRRRTKGKAIPEEKLDELRRRMNLAIRDVRVDNYEPLIEALDLPDKDDRHVLAVAIQAKAQMIATFNLKDFPESSLQPFNVEAKHPDAFVLNQLDLNEVKVHACVQQIVDSRNNSSFEDVLIELGRIGISESARRMMQEREDVH
jgi:predicted nucleic acid-binding protein